MEINNFLEKFVEGYLFCDIENMLKNCNVNESGYGSCGYPVVMSILSGMELLGDLLSNKEIKPRNGMGNGNFISFWDNYFCQRNPGYKINNGGSIVRILMRHGLVHRFLTLPGIMIVKNSTELHWTINPKEKHIWIDISEFFVDFKNTYVELIKNKPGDKFEMQKRLNEIMDLYEKDASSLFKEMENEDMEIINRRGCGTRSFNASTINNLVDKPTPSGMLSDISITSSVALSAMPFSIPENECLENERFKHKR